MIRRLASTLILSAVLFSGAAYAQAPAPSSGGDNGITDTSAHTRPNDFTVMAYLPWYYGFGIGVDFRYEFMILPDGFIPAINDSFSIEPSLGLAYINYGYVGSNYSFFEFDPAVYGVWSFWFSPKFRAYGALGLGVGVLSGGGAYTGPGLTYFYWDLAAGISYKFSDSIAFRAELGREAVKAGLSFYF